ncbi:hypothetical protein QUA62_29035 [Microcoleus sp. MON1_C1]|uniref:hypothetical protein n=1 Tax=Microcoleus sp. MON1_C1 TaxID=2818827 RepID=UPI002FD18A5F
MANGEVLLTRKLIEAVCELAKYWSGSITVMMEETKEDNDQIDSKKFKLDELPFKLAGGVTTSLKPRGGED